MRYGSLCSGIEAASVAWEPLGWEPAWFAEIEKFPSAVLNHHWPDVVNLGDMTKLAEMIERGEVEAPEVLVRGTPCQSWSVVGLRKGIEDDRGKLTFEFLNIVEKAKPKWVVWENVPGLFSIEKGAVLNSFIAYLTKLGYVANLDILDAQFFNVAQRRRRVFVICYNLKNGLKEKTILSKITILKILVEILQLNWDAQFQQLNQECVELGQLEEIKDGVKTKKNTSKITSKEKVMLKSEKLYKEVLKASSVKENGWGCAETLCVDGLKQRITLLEHAVGIQLKSDTITQFSEKLANLLEEICPLSQKDSNISISTSKIQNIEIQQDMDTKELKLEQKQLWNIDVLWKNILEESLNLMNGSTISTETKETIDWKISIYVKTLLDITWRIIAYSELWEPCWIEELSISTQMKEYMNYAKQRQSSAETSGEVTNFYDWIPNLEKAECALSEVIASAREGFDPREILFESEGLRRDTAPSREKGQETSPDVARCIRGAGNLKFREDCDTLIQQVTNELCPTLQARDYKDINVDDSAMGGKHVLMYENHPNDSRVTGPVDQCPTISSRFGTGGGNIPLVQQAMEKAEVSDVKEREKFGEQNGIERQVIAEIDCIGGQHPHAAIEKELCPTITEAAGTGGGHVPIINEPIPINDKATRHSGGGDSRNNDGAGNGLGVGKEGDPSPTLTGGDRHAVAGFLPTQGSKAQGIGYEEEMSPTLRAGCSDYGVHKTSMQIRRLTPLECERLQGFPRGFTDIPYGRPKHKNQNAPDGHRYKALGNSMAVPVMSWIGRRIQQYVHGDAPQERERFHL